MRVHLIRHGTTATSGRVYAGRSDVPLNGVGRRMAETLARALSARPVSRIASSPLSRCVETALPLAQALGLPVETDARLMEFDFGAYEGRTKADLGLRLRKAHAHDPVPGGEALIDVWARAGSVLDDMLSGPDTEIAIVGHFWVNRLIFGRLGGLDFERACRATEYRPKTGSVITLKWSSDEGRSNVPDPLDLAADLRA